MFFMLIAIAEALLGLLVYLGVVELTGSSRAGFMFGISVVLFSVLINVSLDRIERAMKSR